LYYLGHVDKVKIPQDLVQAGKYLRRFADSFFNSETKTPAAIKEAQQTKTQEADFAGIAAALLGRMYWRGEGYEVDEKAAREWFELGDMVVCILTTS
jgi:SEL1 protein